MRVVTDNTYDYRDDSEELRKLLDRLTETYGDDLGMLGPYRVHDALIVYNLLGKDLAGKKILSLGCGSNPPSELVGGNSFQPWFPRAIHHLGGHAIGVDLGNLRNEAFEGHTLDLTEEDSLDFLSTGSIDAADISAFFDSPILEQRHPHLKESKGKVPQALRDFKERIFRDLERIVKPEGFLYFRDQYFQSEYEQ